MASAFDCKESDEKEDERRHHNRHRHFEAVERIEFAGYEALVRRFESEVRELWRTEDEET